MLYNKYIGGLFVIITLCFGVLFADYGIVDGIDTPTQMAGSLSHSSTDFPAGLSLALVHRHMVLSNNIPISTGSISGPVAYIKMLEDGVRFDVIHELEFVDDKGLYLTGYLSDMDHVLSLIDGYTITLQDAIDRTSDERTVCIEQKKEADDRFFSSLSDFNQEATDTALQDSMKAGSCEESARIAIVASILQLNRIKQLHTILLAKQSLLLSNTSMIITYFPLVKTELLQQLLVLSSQLQNYTTSLDQ